MRASRLAIVRRPLPLALGLLLLAACGGNGGSSTAGLATQTKASSSTGCPVTGRQVSFPRLDPSKTYTVSVDTSLGSFAFPLDVKDSPCTTSSFASLVRKHFFDGLIFHRIVPGFVIQGGDPKGNGTGGPGYTVVDTPPSDATYKRGTVAMAKASVEPPGTSGSQFFIVTGADAGLPPDYALLGKVTKGLAVVERIGRLGNAQEQPTRRIVIRRMTLAP
jgi:cyclophilin family peptidyl-prolyl cis-trans isomerase